MPEREELSIPFPRDILINLVYREIGYASVEDALRYEYTTQLPEIIGQKEGPKRHRSTARIWTHTLSGTGVTNKEARRTIRLNEFLVDHHLQRPRPVCSENVSEDRPCIRCSGKPRDVFPTEEVVFTATAESEVPATLTTKVDIEDVVPDPPGWYYPIGDGGAPSWAGHPGKLVDVHVMSWDATGKEVPFVRFNWICIAHTNVRLNPDDISG
jgi:hypothetical protein